MTSPSSHGTPPSRSRWYALTSVLAAAALAAVLTACDGPAPNVAACKQAMQASFRQYLAASASAPAPPRPPQCDGVDDATIVKLAAEVINAALNPSPEPS